ncbi:MAG: S8 family serine peptidase [Armatimonadota bacterium]|nr:S8 family serine peptidase [Armatimonadota bacterium]MDR7460711.1 S8 family serine peptidase [Armatimonadota bacterium]MDR7479702.1 S8 family serine peptidase [Armatimonadota bacterium]MDR7490871.1 S8 family serine peptidase [Armatimonadota bacterium]MDR7501717.1 S8 family serine peptidase [Armatimonadota bacterium]
MRVPRLLLAFVAVAVAAALSVLPVVAGGPAADRPVQVPAPIDPEAALRQAAASGGPVKVVVRLSDAPVAARFGPTPRLDLARGDVQAYARQLADRQQVVLSRIQAVAPGARVLQRFSLTLNGFALVVPGSAIPALRRVPGVAGVTVAREFRPVMNVSLPLINASALWNDLGGARRAGEGIRIGVIDTGIDIRNPCFGDKGYQAPAGFPRTDNPENAAFVNNKVIVARAYPAEGPDSARDTHGHGSHVAGTAACNHRTRATFQGVRFEISGVAPRAFLGNYNVFPNEAESASDEQIIAAIEDAVRDGMHVINMSLGGAALPNVADPLVEATNNAARAGVVPAVAAGNSGPGAQTITSPGTAPGAITAGASTNPHFVGQPVSVTAPANPPADLQNFGGAAGDFRTYDTQTEALYAWWAGTTDSPGTACTATDPTPAVSVRGKIALIARGACTFTEKITNAQNAGAVGVLIYNNVAGDPVAMGHAGGPLPTIPALMVARDKGVGMREWFQSHQDTAAVRVDPTFAEFLTPNADIIAGFSSRGPTPFDLHIKPDVAAPGVNILSAINQPAGFAFFQGTSMATPHVAGASALLRQKFPTWHVDQIKSALVNTGKRPVFDHVLGTRPTGVMTRGGGRIDLARARDPRATARPAHVNFGVVAIGQHEEVVTLTGVGAGGSWSVTVTGPFRPDGSPAAGVTVSVQAASITLAPGAFADLRVTARVAIGARGQYEGDIVLTGTTTLRIPYWLSVGPP